MLALRLIRTVLGFLLRRIVTVFTDKIAEFVGSLVACALVYAYKFFSSGCLSPKLEIFVLVGDFGDTHRGFSRDPDWIF